MISIISSFARYLKSQAVLMFWLILGGSAMTFFICSGCRDSFVWYVKVSVFNAAIWISMWLGNEGISHFLDRKISWTKQPMKRFGFGIAGMLLYTVPAVFFLIQFFEAVLDFDFGGFTGMVYGSVFTTFIITLFMTSRAFLFEWKQAAIQSEVFQKESMRARYESLKSQVNPHFLFNSLNALTNLVYEDQDKAAKFIKQLSEVYRYVLDTRDREVVSLEEELKFLESYVYLQQIRFGENLKIEMSLNGLKTQVVPLAMQMLIENAIKHNVISSESPLKIKLYADEYSIIVENDIQIKKRLPDESPGMGLENIQSRYSFLTERKVEIQQYDKRFVVKLPLIEIK